MSARNTHTCLTQARPGEPKLAKSDSADLDQGWGLHNRQIGVQLLRDLEVQRLPEALAIRDQVLNGEPITEADRESLAHMVDALDRASALLAGEQDLTSAVRGVAALRDEILARAEANEVTAAAVEAMIERAQLRPKSTAATC